MTRGAGTLFVAKIAVIGAGRVGSTFAYTLAASGVAREIVIIDADVERAQGEAMDIAHAVPSDNFIRRIAYPCGDGGHVLRLAGHFGEAAILRQVDIRECRRRSGDQLAVSMFAQHVGVHVSGVDAIVRRKLGT